MIAGVSFLQKSAMGSLQPPVETKPQNYHSQKPIKSITFPISFHSIVHSFNLYIYGIIFLSYVIFPILSTSLRFLAFDILYSTESVPGAWPHVRSLLARSSFLNIFVSSYPNHFFNSFIWSNWIFLLLLVRL